MHKRLSLSHVLRLVYCGVSIPTAEAPQYTRDFSLSHVISHVMRLVYCGIYNIQVGIRDEKIISQFLSD